MDEFFQQLNIKNAMKFLVNIFPKVLIVFGIVLISIHFFGTVLELNDVADVIVREAATSPRDAEEALHVGMMFNRIENCHFKAVDLDGNLVFGDGHEPFFSVNQAETIIDNVRYIYTIDCSSIYGIAMIVVLITCCVIVFIITHIDNVVSFNEKAHDYLRDKEVGMGSSEIISFRNELFDHGPNGIIRKLFNYKVVVWIPVFMFLGCIVMTTQYISDVGLLVTDSIGGIVQHNGVIHSEETVQTFASMEGITIEELHADPHKIPPIVAGGGFHIEDNIAMGYKTLINGNVLRITYDLHQYYQSLISFAYMTTCYSIYLFLMIHKNEKILLVI